MTYEEMKARTEKGENFVVICRENATIGGGRNLPTGGDWEEVAGTDAKSLYGGAFDAPCMAGRSDSEKLAASLASQVVFGTEEAHFDALHIEWMLKNRR